MNRIFHISFLLEYIYIHIYIVSYGPLVYWKERKGGEKKEKERTRIKDFSLMTRSFRLVEACRSYTAAKYKNSFAYKHTSYRIQE